MNNIKPEGTLPQELVEKLVEIEKARDRVKTMGLVITFLSIFVLKFLVIVFISQSFGLGLTAGQIGSIALALMILLKL